MPLSSILLVSVGRDEKGKEEQAQHLETHGIDGDERLQTRASWKETHERPMGLADLGEEVC